MKRSFKAISKKIRKYYPSLSVEEKNGCIRLSGMLNSAQDASKAGLLASGKGYKGVLNDIRIKDDDRRIPDLPLKSNELDFICPSVLIIGAGVLGCAIAREVARYNVSVLVVDKNDDVAMGESSFANGNVKVDFSLKEGSNEWYYAAKGFQAFPRLVKDLDVPFNKCGQLILFSNYFQALALPHLFGKARRQEVKHVKLLGKRKLKIIEPNVPCWAKFAMFIEDSGVVDPVYLNCALAENLQKNNVKVEFNTVVEGMTVERGWIKEVKTNRGVITPQIVVNTAGIFADIVADMAKDRDFTLHTVKENMIVFKPSAPLTRQCEKYPQSRSALSVVPMDGGKVAFASRSDGTPKREDYSTNDVELESLFNASKTFIEDIKKEDVYSFSSCVFGRTYEDKLLIRRGVGTKNVIEVADVKDYALTACQAIAVDVAELAIGMLDGSKENFDFDPIRRSPVKLADLSPERVDETIRTDSDYGKIVCRCAQISKGEILDVIKADDIHTVDGVKRRLGVGNGECKGTHCSIKIAEILAEYYDVPLENIKSTGGGTILYGDTKGLKK